MDPAQLEAFQSRVLEILEGYPEGLGEYELMQELSSRVEPNYMQAAFRDTLSLFQHHFLLFHTLYALQRRLCRERQTYLEISPSKIALRAMRANEGTQLAQTDPMCEYYLDLSNLDNTGQAEVDALFAAFWQWFHDDGRRGEALAVLGLEDPVDEAAIKRRYRRLAMEHHPDRGGDKEKLQQIHDAVRVLLRKSRS